MTLMANYEKDFEHYVETIHTSQPVPQPPEPLIEANAYTPLLASNIRKMKVKELREELAARSQRQSGTKNELIER